jgi:hypothetical protein
MSEAPKIITADQIPGYEVPSDPNEGQVVSQVGTRVSVEDFQGDPRRVPGHPSYEQGQMSAGVAEQLGKSATHIMVELAPGGITEVPVHLR